MKKIFILAIIALMLLSLGCGQKQTQDAKTATPEKTTQTEIKAIGQGATIVISPTIGKNVKGMITLTLTEMSADAKIISFAMERSGGEPIVLGQANSDDWSILVDTTLYENGLYDIGGVTFTSSSSREPIGMARTQILIDN
ncbi:lipoprotein [Nanoarchaeota archaeon]